MTHLFAVGDDQDTGVDCERASGDVVVLDRPPAGAVVVERRESRVGGGVDTTVVDGDG